MQQLKKLPAALLGLSFLRDAKGREHEGLSESIGWYAGKQYHDDTARSDVNPAGAREEFA